MAQRQPTPRPTSLAGDDLHASVGVLLGDARQAAGMAQSEVARRMGVAQSRIAKLELGTRRLLYVEALELAELYGVDLSRFDPRTAQSTKPARRARVGPRQVDLETGSRGG